MLISTAYRVDIQHLVERHKQIKALLLKAPSSYRQFVESASTWSLSSRIRALARLKEEVKAKFELMVVVDCLISFVKLLNI